MVEDNADAADSFAMLVSLWGYDVRVCRTAHECLWGVATLRPQVVFLDIGLPQMDGYEVARHLRSRPDFEDLVIIAITGYADETHREKGRQDFDPYLAKPADPERIRDLLIQAQDRFEKVLVGCP